MPTLDAPPPAIFAPVGFADLWADAGEPCVLCGCHLDPRDADGSKIAHRICAENELFDLSDSERSGSWFEPSDDDLEEMFRANPRPTGWSDEQIAAYEASHGEQSF